VPSEGRLSPLSETAHCLVACRPAFLALVLCLVLANCEPARRAPAPPPSETVELATCLRQEAILSLTAAQKEACRLQLEKLLETRGKDPGTDWASFQLGRFYMEKMDFSSAYQVFSLFPTDYPASPKRWLARLHLGICLYFLGRFQDSLEVLQKLAADPKQDSQTIEIFRYMAEDYAAMRNLPSALAWFQRSESLMTDEAARQKLQKRVLEILGQGWPTESLRQAANLFPEGFFAEAVRFGSAASAYADGQPRLAKGYLYRLSDKHPDDVFTPQVAALLDRISSESLPEVCAVGCLLPLSGKFGKFGTMVLDALLLAARAFQPQDSGSAIRLIVRDTRGNPQMAVAMLRELAKDGEVVGIVGPLLTAEALACAGEAGKLMLPMVTLSQREDVARAGGYVFVNGLTLNQQVDALVKHAVNTLGFSRFGLLYPANSQGKLAHDLFIRKVQEAGGRVSSSISYGTQEADFQQEIRLLVGDAYLPKDPGKGGGNQGERTSRSRNSTEDGSGSAESQPGAQEADKRPPLPFEALFIPDDYLKISLIAPYLAFYDIRGIVLLGTSAWNSPLLVQRAGEYLQDAIFVDGFFAGSRSLAVADFVEEYLTTFGREPGLLEALGYDSLMILDEAFLRAQPKTRTGLRDSLAGIRGYPGLTGNTRFDRNGCARKNLFLLTIQDDRIQEIN